jgi:hypothetical protein
MAFQVVAPARFRQALRQEEKKLQEEKNILQRQLDERVKKLAMDRRLN